MEQKKYNPYEESHRSSGNYNLSYGKESSAKLQDEKAGTCHSD
jgi:hypothetical protein